jgi:hypothetical protein
METIYSTDRAKSTLKRLHGRACDSAGNEIQTVGTRLSRLQGEKESLYDFAERIDISLETAWRFYEGVRLFERYDEFLAACESLGVHPAWLGLGEAPPDDSPFPWSHAADPTCDVAGIFKAQRDVVMNPIWQNCRDNWGALENTIQLIRAKRGSGTDREPNEVILSRLLYKLWADRENGVMPPDILQKYEHKIGPGRERGILQ